MKTTFLMIAVVALVGCGSGTPDLTANPKLEKAIRKHLAETRGVMPTGKLTKEDFAKVTELNLAGAAIGDAGLKEVAKLTQLTYLSIGTNQLTSVKGLEKLTQLTSLGLGNNQLADVKGLEKLTQLTRLGLDGNQLTDVTGLEKLTQLTYLNLHDNYLFDVTGLEKLTQLSYLGLSGNQLTNVKGLEKLTQLSYLDLSDNPDLTNAQIAELQKVLPKCRIGHNAKK